MIFVWAVLTVLFVSFGMVVFRGAPYVPTRKATIKTALKLAPLKKDDLIVDLGSGDGSVLLQAARQGYKGVGFELNPLLNIVARWRCRGLNAHFYTRDFWLTPLPPDAAVVFVFLAGPFMRQLHRKLRSEAIGRARPLYVVSNGFRIPGKTPVASKDGLLLYKY